MTTITALQINNIRYGNFHIGKIKKGDNEMIKIYKQKGINNIK